MMKCLTALIVLYLTTALQLSAQQFEVQSFRLLQNDITAWMNPVRDLNNEACALIKVVGQAEFAFTTPLGIVLRKNEVGETWIYVPNGTIQITIKHPHWGVLRDYSFPAPLESRLSYELVLTSPPAEDERQALLKTRSLFSLQQNNPFEVSLQKQPKQKLSSPRPAYFAIADVGIQDRMPSYGLMLGVVKKHGAYLHLRSNLHFTASDGTCNREGRLPENHLTPYYTGKNARSSFTATAGALHRIVGLFFLYEGIGYGKRITTWQTLEGLQLENSAYSTTGISAEVGGLVKIQRITFSLGIITIRGKYWEPTLGVGIIF